MSDPTAPAAPPARRPGANDVVPPPEGALLLTVGEAAYLLGVSASTVRKLADEGQLRSTRLRSAVRISREAVADFVRLNDTAKRPTSEAAIRADAEAKATQAVRLKTRVVADWNKGGQGHGLDTPPRIRAPRAKGKSPASA